jgi:sulfopyruvate decarboxylase TPP-binding subunit
MLTGEKVVAELKRVGITHVVWVPDSTLGQWEQALAGTPGLQLIRVCREGEAWAVAAGLYLGGARPLVMIQCTGLFDSGDSLRNALFDYQLPLLAVIGYRSALIAGATDSARTFTEPCLRSWGLDYRLLERPEDVGEISAYFSACLRDSRPGVILIAEGRM